MRASTLRRFAVPAVAALAVLAVLAGCGDDGGGDDAGPSTTSAGEGSTSMVADEGSTTTVGGEGASTTTEAGAQGTSTTEPGDGEPGDGAPDDTAPDDTAPGAPGPGQEGAGAPDEEAPDVSWDLSASRYRGADGTRVAFLCPPDGEVGPVWGGGTYTDASSVCSAAVHAGIINPVEGGRVVIEIAPGLESYEGSEANGVTSRDHASWPGSFTFPVG